MPTLAPVAVSDDWIFTRSVEVLRNQHRLVVLPLANPSLLFQVFWAAPFVGLFGMTLGVVRLSVVVLWLLSGIAFYGLAWELTRRPALSALGAAVYLFNPIGYALAFTFMTDAPLTAMIVIALYCYVRGLRGEGDPRWVIAGSVAAAGATLVRQPGVLVPLGVVCVLLLDRRAGWKQRREVLAVEAAALPAVAYVLHQLWLRYVNGVPVTQQLVYDEVFGGGFEPLLKQTEQLAFIEAIYVGLFVLPLAAGAALALPRVLRTLPPWGWLAFLPWAALIAVGMTISWGDGLRMPYIPHFFSKAGLGPNDLIGARAPIIEGDVRDVLTVACALAAVIVGLVVVRALANGTGERRGVVPLLAVLFWQAAAVIPTSAHFRLWRIDGHPAPSLDRYLLPLMPLVIAIAIWALRDVKFSHALAWPVTIALAAFAVVGTRDNLVFHQAIWNVARSANDAGVSNLHLDAGASWDGYYLGEYSYEQLGYHSRPGGLWWLQDFTPIIDSQYVVAGHPLPGHTVVREYPYELWLDSRPTRLFLLRREDVPGPP